jgi:hypothetical protein
MRVYLDDDSAAHKLAGMLRRAGHDVTLPAQVNLSGQSDPRHLAHAIQQGLVLLTRNHKDFPDLHDLILAAGGSHPGILVVRSDNDPTRDMKPADVVRAIANREAAGIPLVNDLCVLNHWR